MRIRRKPWAKQELEEAKFYIDDPTIYKGKWKEQFEDKEKPLHLEIGCGKGSFIAKLASKHQENNYISADMIEAMLGLSKRNIETEYANKNLEIKNLLLIRMNAERILDVFDENDKIDRIYINFCNPWPRGKHHKKRLTHTRQLEKYKQFLVDGGKIYFKTADDNLFTESLLYFKEAGFEIEKVTYDLANEQDFWNGDRNIETEHERMFKEQGIKIKALIARK